MVREDRIELSPRVSRTRMLALHHARKKKSEPKRGSVGSGQLTCWAKYEAWTRRYRISVLTSSLDTYNLLDLSDNFNQIFLVLHHRFN